MAESKVITLIITEAIILMGLLTCALTVYVLYLRKKLVQLSNELHPELNTDMKSSVNSEDDQSISDSKGNDAWKLDQFLRAEIDDCERIYHSLTGVDIPDQLDKNTNPKLVTIFIRHRYLKEELKALPLRKDPEPFWSALMPALTSIGSLIPSKEMKRRVQRLKLKNRELAPAHDLFYLLQKLMREQLPDKIVGQMLPLSEEVEILQLGKDLDAIVQHYENTFSTIDEHTKKTGSSSGLSKDKKQHIENLNQVSITQEKSLETLGKFLDELNVQTSLPEELMSSYNNFIANLRAEYDENNKRIESTQRLLTESEMCNNVLESELESAQETMKSLVETIEEYSVQKEEQHGLIEQFTRESRDMLLSIQMLQDENKELREKINESKG